MLTQIKKIQDKFKEQNIELITHKDLNTFKTFFNTVNVHESMKTIPTFDPTVNKSLNETNSFWFEIKKDMKSVGCVAAKVWETDNVLNDIHTLKTWYEDGNNKRYKIINTYDSMPKLSGKWSTGGKLWLDPMVRKTGMSKLLTVLIRITMAVEYNTVGHFCIIKQNLVQKEVDTTTYLYNKPSSLVLNVIDTETNENMNFCSNYISLADIKEQLTISL